jgi:UDP-2-acetamido-2,6-beta-L-arabino-hexul-4-ose reductase
MRLIDSKEISEYRVSGSEYDVVNIPPGYTHSITNIGPSEMTTLFWASEVFDPDNPDTYYQNVDDETRPPLAEPPDGLAAASGLAARGR